MRAACRAAIYAGRTTCSTKYKRKRTSAPVSATDANAQSDASIARIRTRTHAANATQTGTTTPTRTWPDPGPLPGGFGIEPPAQTPRIGATTRQIGASQTRGRNLCVASASTLARHRHLRPVLKATASGDCETRRVGLSGAVASLVVVVPLVTRRVTGRFLRALGMICPGARRRRSGARCWLDQELVRLGA